RVARRLASLPLEECEILDLGCGTGQELRNLIRFGARPERLHGIDLLSERIEEARRLAPGIDFREGDATRLPWPDESFDLVMQSTVFSSIVDEGVQIAVAREMTRVLKPGGFVLWYDMRVTDPRNRDLVPMTRKRVRALFEGGDVSRISLESLTLNPWIVRWLAPHAWWACSLLEGIPPLRSHLLGWIEKS
ncbi:MAG: class I SAM-dependent methyltransferase, partial [Bacteroidota bacterium]